MLNKTGKVRKIARRPTKDFTTISILKNKM
jgi:hypothetical protein